MDALTHRLAAVVGLMATCDKRPYSEQAAIELVQAAKKVHAQYEERCNEQAGLEHYHGREGG